MLGQMSTLATYLVEEVWAEPHSSLSGAFCIPRRKLHSPNKLADRDSVEFIQVSTSFRSRLMTRMSSVLTTVVATGVLAIQPVKAQDSDEKLGSVHFETSCTPEAQKFFDRGMLYQHSFWYRASQHEFEAVLKADPSCGIAYWGIALSMLLNPHVPTPAKNLAEGSAAIAKGQSVGAKSQRERDYIDALAVIYVDHDKLGHLPRTQAYAKAMEKVAQRYPNDDEAQIHYALALNTSASPADKTYANQLKGAAILEPIFKRQPQHPGVAHYLIHLYDYPPIAEKGLDAARRYSKIAPAAAHASICPRTSSRASAIGRTRSPPMPNRRGSRQPTRRATISCTPW